MVGTPALDSKELWSGAPTLASEVVNVGVDKLNNEVERDGAETERLVCVGTVALGGVAVTEGAETVMRDVGIEALFDNEVVGGTDKADNNESVAKDSELMVNETVRLLKGGATSEVVDTDAVVAATTAGERLTPSSPDEVVTVNEPVSDDEDIVTEVEIVEIESVVDGSDSDPSGGATIGSGSDNEEELEADAGDKINDDPLMMEIDDVVDVVISTFVDVVSIDAGVEFCTEVIVDAVVDDNVDDVSVLELVAAT